MPKIIKSGRLYRHFELNREDIDKENRTVELSFSSESQEIERWFGIEILDHDKKSVNLRRLNNGGALLLEHSRDRQVGVIEKAEIGTGRKGRAVVRFGKSVLADEVFQDVLDGIRKNVSVGYRVRKMVLEEENKDAPDKYRVTDWEPTEVSIVAIPADTSVGVGRADEEKTEIIIINQRREAEMPEIIEDKKEKRTEEQGSGQVDIGKERSEAAVDARNEERSRIAEIYAIGDAHNCRELAQKYVADDKSADAFRHAVLESLGAKPVETQPEIGMSNTEVKQYSLVKALREQADFKDISGLEREASDATAKIVGKPAKGFFIPHDMMKAGRALSASDATKGGYTVGTDVLGGDMIEMLRNKALVSQMGARTMSGLIGNVLIPRITGGGAAYWLSETGSVSQTDQTFGQLGLTPKRLVGNTAYSKELLAQSSIDVEAFVRGDLMQVLALAKDLGAINGLGANGQPVGIMNTTGIKTVTFGAAPTFAKAVDFETQIAGANADVEAMAYLTTPAVRGAWKTTVKTANQAIFLWEKGVERGVGDVNGYPAYATNQVPSDRVVFGNWRDLIIAEWAGLDVVVDPFTLKKTGQIEITITLLCDIGVRHAESFCVSTDAGNQ